MLMLTDEAEPLREVALKRAQKGLTNPNFANVINVDSQTLYLTNFIPDSGFESIFVV